MDRPSPRAGWAPRDPWALGCAAAGFALAGLIVLGRWLSGGVFIDDDAYYYFIIARHVAATGVSTFDQQSLTNGYHPLWLAVLVLQYLTVGPSMAITLILGIGLVSAGLYAFLRCAPDAPPPWKAGFTLILLSMISHFSFGGMEEALLMFCLGLFVVALGWAERGGLWRGAMLGLAAAACVGARIDCAVFIAPAVLFAPLSRPVRACAFLVMGVLGAAYVVYNVSMFGLALPVSSAVKSVGGLQVNGRALAQLGLWPDHRRHDSLLMMTVAGLIASAALVPLSRPGSLARTLAWASSLGGAVFLFRVFCMSSWMVWPWYNFAIVFPLLAAFYAGPSLIARLLPPAAFAATLSVARGRVMAVAMAVIFALCAAVSFLWPMRGHPNTFDAINRLAVQRYGAVLGGARVAMGDRAGSFAMAYAGPVLQLEGLVNDKAYLAAVSRPGDLRPLLCARGVRFILDYDDDLGAYARLRVYAMRPYLTQFHGATVDVWRSDEVGHVTDLARYDNRALGDSGNSTLYIWRLRCGGPSGV